MTTKVSIVINTLNRCDHLANALNSLRYLRYDNFEVIVVNGPSEDDTEEMLEAWQGEIKYVVCDVANLSVSRNIGIREASGEIVAFIDDDAVPEPNWLDYIVPIYDDERVGAVGGYLRNHTGVDFQCKVVACDRFGDSRNFDSLEQAKEFIEDGNENFFLSQTGANSTFRRSYLVEVGGFDEEYVYFLDETDVNLRIQEAGYTLVYAPCAEVHHKYAPSNLRDENKIPKSRYRTLKSQAYFAAKYARDGVELHDAFVRLARLNLETKHYNQYYFDAEQIDGETLERFNIETEKGIEDGLRQLFMQSSPKYYSARASDTQFKKFPSIKKSSDRIKICFISRDYPPNVNGGIGVWTHELANGIAKLGHEVTVITIADSEHPTVDFESGVWVHRIVPKWQPSREDPVLPDIPQIIKDYAYTAYDEVMRLNDFRGVDIVSAPIWDLEGIACVASGKIPTITSLHTTFKFCKPFKPEWNMNNDYEKLHVDKIIDGEKYLLKNSRYLLANSHAVAAEVEQSYAGADIYSRVKVIPHGLFDQSDRCLTSVKGSKGIKILFVGRFEKRKGIDLLLNAIPNIFSDFEAIEFHLVGNHDIKVDKKILKEEFEKEHSREKWFDRVFFHGFVSNEELHSHYASCDIFVAPSRYESFGLIFLEAMMFGKPCIGTSVGGITEVLGSSGILIEPIEGSGLTDALTTLISNKELRDELGAKARERFEKEFTEKIMADRIVSACNDWVASVDAAIIRSA